ncbi:CLUMA_CG017830, isoform A [Clunio marinus]|uniref:CLUMA_CG017830, isoform A n=1 Tax=Clunio marinus TaxID=568069 RepID=A0A1J1IYJ7_9DIPT|nr:CLUMA_CG017830, isoform A [Clunio marinus]
MGLKEDFDQAAAEVKKLKASPSNDDLLVLYSLFKQATVGDNSTEKPGMLDFKGKAKWQAWFDRKGMSADDAMKQYVEKVNSLIASIGLA